MLRQFFLYMSCLGLFVISVMMRSNYDVSRSSIVAAIEYLQCCGMEQHLRLQYELLASTVSFQPHKVSILVSMAISSSASLRGCLHTCSKWYRLSHGLLSAGLRPTQLISRVIGSPQPPGQFEQKPLGKIYLGLAGHNKEVFFLRGGVSVGIFY